MGSMVQESSADQTYAQPTTQQAYGQPPAQQQTDGFAIAALVTGILGMNIVAVVLGHLSLSRMKKDPNLGGRGMAIAGLVLGYVVLTFWVLWFLFIAALIGTM